MKKFERAAAEIDAALQRYVGLLRVVTGKSPNHEKLEKIAAADLRNLAMVLDTRSDVINTVLAADIGTKVELLKELSRKIKQRKENGDGS